MSGETVFPVLPARRRAKVLHTLRYAVAGLAAVWIAVSNGGWGWWALTGVLLGLAIGKLIALLRMRYVAKVDASGITVCLPSGREMRAGWGEIEAHTIDPQKALGGLVLRAGPGGRVKIVPIATRDMGDAATNALLAALKDRLPKLEYRVPTVGRR